MSSCAQIYPSFDKHPTFSFSANHIARNMRHSAIDPQGKQNLNNILCDAFQCDGTRFGITIIIMQITHLFIPKHWEQLGGLQCILPLTLSHDVCCCVLPTTADNKRREHQFRVRIKCQRTPIKKTTMI